MGEMVQKIRGVEAPAAAAKVFEGELDVEQIRQKNFIAVRTLQSSLGLQ